MKRNRYEDIGISKWAVVGITLVIAVIVLFIAFALSTTQISPGEVGVPVFMGRPTGAVWAPGLHWKAPFLTRVVRYKTLARSYETSDNPDKSGANYTDYPITAQTIDGQQIEIKTTTLFKVSATDPIQVLNEVGDMGAIVENVIKAHTRNLTRLYAQGFTAEDLYSGDGIFDFQEQISKELKAEFAQRGVTLDDFLLRKIDFDEEYVAVIEDQQQAKERIETAEYEAGAAEFEKQKVIRAAEAEAERQKLNAQAEAYRNVELAKAEAERKRVDADAQAYVVKTVADADAYQIEQIAKSEAEALRIKGEQLTRHPGLIEYRLVENFGDVMWGILPSESVVQFLPLDKMGAMLPEKD